MLLLDNFVHADLHPGNILVKFYKPTTGFVLKSIIASLFNSDPPIDPVNTSDAEEVVRNLVALRKRGNREEWSKALQALHADGYQPELVFLDAGLVTTLSEMNRRNFLDLFQAIATFDGYRAGQLMVSRSASPELAIDPETFALKMQHLVLSVKAKTFSLGQIRISDVLSQVLRFVREHHVKMEGEFVNTVISVLLLEGIGRQLDPDMDLFKSALPILRQLGRQVTAKEAIADGPAGTTGAMIKVRGGEDPFHSIFLVYFYILLPWKNKPVETDNPTIRLFLTVLGVARGSRVDQCSGYQCGRAHQDRLVSEHVPSLGRQGLPRPCC
jgi:aarF domain-containing kinase